MAGHATYQPKSRFASWLESAAADHRPRPLVVRRLSDAAQPELLVDLRRASSPSCSARRSSPASCWPCTTSPRRRRWPSTSVEHIMRDVNYGWLLRYLHANGASMFFLAVYIHMFRGLYYGSYKEPREVLWILGVIIFLLMMATAFMGYVLPWGQMSFWAATVITNLFTAIPLVGEPITTWLWGGFAVDNPTLNRFFSLHYLLPFMIAGVVVLHIWALHVAGQQQSDRRRREGEAGHGAVPRRYCTIKDVFGLVGVPDPVRLARVLPAELSRPPGQLHPGQPAEDAGAHRAGMVLPAVLRDPARHPEQARSASSRCSASIAILVFVPWLDTSRVRSAIFRPLYRQFFWIFVAGRHRPRLSRLAAAGRRLRHRRAHPDRLLLRPLPHHPAAPRPDREAEAAAGQHHRSGARQERGAAPARATRREARRMSRALLRAAAVVALVVRGAVVAAQAAAPLPAAAAQAPATAARRRGRRPHFPPEAGDADWSFAGFFGTFDAAQLQRGFQVYKEVCANCHSMNLRRLPQPRRRGRPAFQRGRGQGARGRATRSPTGRTTPATCSSGRAGRPTTSRRRSPTRRPRPRPMAAPRRPTCR